MGETVPTDAELQRLGLYDPSWPQADEVLALLRYLIELGATTTDLIEYRAELPGLATVLIARPGPPRYTTHDVVEKTGMSADVLKQLWRAAGFSEVADDAVAFSDADLETLQLIAGARELFGEEAVVQLSRVIGSSLARIADAAVSAFLVNIEVPIVASEPQGLAIAKANHAAASLLPGLSRAMDTMLRHHILAARRSLMAWQETGIAGYEVQDLAVGFIDLVGSTALAQRVSSAALGRALSEFEARVSDAVVAQRGRVVKLIGDEVMFVAPDIVVACRIALDVAATFAGHPLVPPVRSGVASGSVLSRDGDYFGPVVNLAARLVKASEPGVVVVPAELRSMLEAAALETSSIGTQKFDGFDEPVELLAVSNG